MKPNLYLFNSAQPTDYPTEVLPISSGAVISTQNAPSIRRGEFKRRRRPRGGPSAGTLRPSTWPVTEEPPGRKMRQPLTSLCDSRLAAVLIEALPSGGEAREETLLRVHLAPPQASSLGRARLRVRRWCWRHWDECRRRSLRGRRG